MANKLFTYEAKCKDCGKHCEIRCAEFEASQRWAAEEKANPGKDVSCDQCVGKRDYEGAFQDCRNCGHELNGANACPDCGEPVE